MDGSSKLAFIDVISGRDAVLNSIVDIAQSADVKRSPRPSLWVEGIETLLLCMDMP